MDAPADVLQNLRQRERNRERYKKLNIIRRRLRDQQNFFDWPLTKFRKEFRLGKNSVTYLINVIKDHTPARRPTAVPVKIKVFASLSLYATGQYQRVIENVFYVALSQPTMSRVIREI